MIYIIIKNMSAVPEEFTAIPEAFIFEI